MKSCRLVVNEWGTGYFLNPFITVAGLFFTILAKCFWQKYLSKDMYKVQTKLHFFVL